MTATRGFLVAILLACFTTTGVAELPDVRPVSLPPKLVSSAEASEAQGGSKLRFPRISLVRSSDASKGKAATHAQNLKDPGRPVDLNKDDVLTERAKIITGKGNEVRLEIDAFSSVIIFENSEVEIPVITWGEGQVQDVVLLKGKIRVNCEKKCGRNFQTPLSKNMFANGVFLLAYNPEGPVVELTTLHGGQDFRGLENEDSVTIGAGQKVAFQGLIENGEIAYDILLKGRRVARGKLLPVVSLKPEELEGLDHGTQEFKAAPVVKKKVAPRLPSQICDAPFGELNQCSWVCEGLRKGMKSCDLSRAGVSCVRRRCNANGQWEDASKLPKLISRCELQPIVAACDY